MEMREWLSIIVIIAIVLIVADGFRRKRKERNPVKMKLDRRKSQVEISADDEASAELPSGGARTIPRDLYQADKEPRGKVVRGRQQRKTPMERTLDFEEKVPVLMDSVAIQPDEFDAEEADAPRFASASAGAAASTSSHAGRAFQAGRKSWDDDDEEGDGFGEDDDDEFDEDDDEDEDFDDEDDDFDEDEDDADIAGVEYDGNDEFDEEYDEEDLDDEEDEFDEEDEGFDDEDDLEEDELDVDEENFGYEEEDEEEMRFDRANGAGRIEPTFGADQSFSDQELENGRFSADAGQPASRAAASATASRPARRAGAADKAGSATENAARAGNAASRHGQAELPLHDERSAGAEAGEEELGAPEEVIVINVMARKGEAFSGKDLLPIIMKQGLRLGDMSIFHRHADSNGNGPVIYSMANMVKPGTFDMAGMEDFTTPGVSLFQQLPGPLDNMKNFDRMLATANAIRDGLGGELKDERRSVLTRQTTEHYRQRIRDFELRQLARK